MTTVEFQHTFRLANGWQDFDVIADVNTAERFVERLTATRYGERRPARLTPAQAGELETKAIKTADDLWRTP